MCAYTMVDSLSLEFLQHTEIGLSEAMSIFSCFELPYNSLEQIDLHFVLFLRTPSYTVRTLPKPWITFIPLLSCLSVSKERKLRRQCLSMVIVQICPVLLG